jgi:hypothetical protein
MNSTGTERIVTNASLFPCDFSSTKPRTNLRSFLVMKPIIPFALLGALFAIGAAKAAVTDPVGYISHSITGNVAANPLGADTWIGPALTNPVDFAGITSISPSGLTTLTFSGGVPTGLDSTSYLEITSGTSEGWWSQIVSSTATTVVISDTVPTLTGNVNVKVRKLMTVGVFLGANAPGLATDAGTPDEVIILDPVTQGTQTVIRSVPPNTSPAGWVDNVSYADASGVYLYPGTGLTIRRFGVSDLSFTSSGDVKTGKTQVDVLLGDNLVAFPYAVGNTFNGSNIAAQLGTDVSAFPDEVIQLGTNQGTTTFVSSDTDPGAGVTLQMVESVNYTEEGTRVIGEGTGLVIRRPGGSGGIITFPAQVIVTP